MRGAAVGRGRPSEVTRWAMYAWANHGWVTTVGTVLIGPWLLALATASVGSDRATLFSIGPWQISAGAYPSFVITLASLIQVVVLPVFGAAADAGGRRRRMLAVTCAVGSAIAAALAVTGGSAWLLAGVLFLAGSLVFGATDVVYNAFLPHLVPPEGRDRASGHGFALGYLGAALLLAIDLALLQFHGVLGVDRTMAVRLCYLSAGVWWAAFGLPVALGLREPGTRARAAGPTTWIGLRELGRSLRLLGGMPHVLRYLIAYLFFADAISAVIGLASTYITHELFGSDAGAAAPFLLALNLMILIVAVAGSLFWARIAARFNTKRTTLVTLLVWCGVVVYAYAALHTKAEAVVLGVVIGLVVGGSQALARSLFSQMVPLGRETTFFSLYEICDKGTSWIAPLLFTVVVNATGSFRQAILSLVVMFIIGIILLTATNIDRACAEAAFHNQAERRAGGNIC